MTVTGKCMNKRALAPAVAAVVLGVLPLLGSSVADAEPQTASFSNAAALVIGQQGQFPPPWKAATPGTYPSPVTVSGMSGTVTDVNVTLNDVDCPLRPNLNTTDPNDTVAAGYPEDMDIMLVAPDGTTRATILSDVFGDNQRSTGGDFQNLTIVLDDQAAAPLPAETLPVSNSTLTAQPLDDENDASEDLAATPTPTTDLFSNTATDNTANGSPQQDAPFSGPTESGAVALSTFNGLAANGTWNLYYVDDTAGFEYCDISGGWTLSLTTTGPTTTLAPTTTTVAQADLAVTHSASTTSTRAGRRLTYTARVTNNGPATANGLVVTIDLPDDFAVSRKSPSTCTVEAGNVLTCTYASLAPGSRVSAKVTGSYPTPGARQTVASVSSATADPNTANNTSSPPLTVNIT